MSYAFVILSIDGVYINIQNQPCVLQAVLFLLTMFYVIATDLTYIFRTMLLKIGGVEISEYRVTPVT